MLSNKFIHICTDTKLILLESIFMTYTEIIDDHLYTILEK